MRIIITFSRFFKSYMISTKNLVKNVLLNPSNKELLQKNKFYEVTLDWNRLQQLSGFIDYRKFRLHVQILRRFKSYLNQT